MGSSSPSTLAPTEEPSAWSTILQQKLSKRVREDEVVRDIFGLVRDPNVLAYVIRRTLAKASSKTPGIDGLTRDHYRARGIEPTAQILAEKLRGGRYRFSPTRTHRIAKPTGGYRELNIPTLEDRCVESAALFVLEPITPFPACVHGFRTGHGTRTALDQIPILLGDPRTDYILEADLHAFFPSIPHEMVLLGLKRYTTDKYLLRLVKRLLRRAPFGEKPSAIGLSQGGPLSPYLANVAFSHIDDEITSLPEVVGLVRYADDLYIAINGNVCSSEIVHKNINEIVTQNRLSFSPSKTHLRNVHQKSYSLGHEFRRRPNGEVITAPALSRTAKLKDKLTKAVRNQTTHRLFGNATEFNTYIEQMRAGWTNYFRPRELSKRIFDEALANALANGTNAEPSNLSE